MPKTPVKRPAAKTAGRSSSAKAKAKTGGKSAHVPCRYAVDEKAGTVSVALSVSAETLEAVLGAAYLLTDRAWARLDGDRQRALTVTLRPKDPKAALKALAEDFLDE